jgi:hypothetical protein
MLQGLPVAHPGHAPNLSAWIGLVAIAVVIGAISWFNGRTSDKMARKFRPRRGGSAGGGAGMGGAGGMDEERE